MPSVVAAELEIDHSSTSSAHLFSERPYKEQKQYASTKGPPRKTWNLEKFLGDKRQHVVIV